MPFIFRAPSWMTVSHFSTCTPSSISLVRDSQSSLSVGFLLEVKADSVYDLAAFFGSPYINLLFRLPSMQFKKFKPFKGPARYLFKDPYRGRIFHGATREELKKRVEDYRRQNNQPPLEYFDAVLDNYLCGLPENKDNCVKTKPLDRSIFATIQGGIALLTNIFYGEKNMVSQEEADRRARICLKCPHNVVPETHTTRQAFDRYADQIMAGSVHDRMTPYDKELYNCGLCTCVLRAKVHLKGAQFGAEDLEQARKPDGAPKDCWQLPENKNKEVT